MKATPEDVAKHDPDGAVPQEILASMKATPEDVAKVDQAKKFTFKNVEAPQ